MQPEVQQEVEQSLVCHQLCLPYQLCSNQLLKLTKHRISAIKGKNTIMAGGGVGGSTPFNGLYGKAPPKGPWGIPFSGFRHTEGLGFHLVKYMKR